MRLSFECTVFLLMWPDGAVWVLSELGFPSADLLSFGKGRPAASAPPLCVCTVPFRGGVACVSQAE